MCQNNIILYRVQSYICSVISFSDKLHVLPHIIHVVPLKEIIYPICNKAVAFSGDFRRFGEMCIKTFRRKRNGAINLMQDICHILYWETSEQTSTLHSSLYSNLFLYFIQRKKMYINHMLRDRRYTPPVQVYVLTACLKITHIFESQFSVNFL